MAITSHAISTNSTWPLVTLPDFERRGTATSKLAEVMSMIMAPLVTDESRSDWEAYSVDNQGWFAEGIEVQAQQKLEAGKEFQKKPVAEIPDEIYRVSGLSAARERGPGPYLPQWQIAPVVPVPNLVNFNLLSHPGYEESLKAVLETEVAIVGRSVDFSDPRDEQTAGRRDVFNLFLTNWEEDNRYDEDPVADVHVPVYDGFLKETRKIAGILTCVVYWRTYFVDILPDNANGTIVVLENTCDQQYTYQIDGPSVSYVGPGDMHDSKYDHLMLESTEGSFLQLDNEIRGDVDGSCLYNIRVYPSADLESRYITNGPFLYTGVLAIIFIFTSGVFMFYDCLVERRQRVVMDTAVASSAIVHSLFPKVVRDRLYNKEGDTTKNASTKNSPTKETKEMKLEQDTSSSGNDGGIEGTRPIADLFNNCTVLFAGKLSSIVRSCWDFELQYL